MERINPYAVMRNTATHEAYKAYNREAWKAGEGLFMAAAMLPAVWVPFQVLAEQRLLHANMANLPLFGAFLLAPAVLSLLLAAIGAVKMMRFRREHPIPEEWRQIPPVRWPSVAAQRSRRPSRG